MKNNLHHPNKKHMLFFSILVVLLSFDLLFSQNNIAHSRNWNIPNGKEYKIQNGMPFLILKKNLQFTPDQKTSFSLSPTTFSKQSQTKLSASDLFQPVSGPYGGTVRSIALGSDGWLYIGTDGEVYRSKDNGMTWDMNLFPSQLHNFVEPVTVLGPNVVVAETDWNNFISRDKGETWGYLQSDARGFAVDTNGVIYAGSSYNGVKISTDTAKTWQNFILPGKKIRKVILGGAGRMACSADSGTYYSTDSGITWIFNSYDTIPIMILAGDKHGNLYSPNAPQYSQLYRSRDFGKTWEIISLPVNEQKYRIYVEKNGRISLVTYSKILISEDKGESWDVINYKALTVGRDASGNLLVGNFYGLHKYNSISEKWTDINNGIHARRIEGTVHTPSGVMLVLSLGEIFKSTDSGVSWSIVKPDSNVFIWYYAPIVSTLNGNIFIAAHLNNSSEIGLIRSIDNAESWESIPILSNHYAISGITEGALGELLVSTTIGDIYRSTNNGDSWEKVVVSSSHSAIKAIAADSTGNYYAVKDSTILISRDGTTWKSITFEHGSAAIASMCIDTHNEVFLATLGDGVYHSNDFGESWKPMNKGLFNRYVMSTVSDDRGNVVLGTADGIFRLADSVDSWEYYSAGSPSTFTTSLEISPEGYLFAGTQSFGLYKSIKPLTARISQTDLPPKITRFILYHNYPNPFNDNTVIRFKVPFTEDVEIKIYNIQGQVVSDFFNTAIPEGDYRIIWKPEQLSSGLYFCRMQVGSFLTLYQKTIKLMYIK